MYNKVYEYLASNCLIYVKQIGFQEKRSTIDAIAEMSEKIRLNKSKVMKKSVFFDL